MSTTQPLRPEEIRAIKAWLKARQAMQPATDAFFVSERRGPLSHMLRHACGYALADQGADTRLIQDYLGHRNIQHTVRYTAANPARFEKLWR